MYTSPITLLSKRKTTIHKAANKQKQATPEQVQGQMVPRNAWKRPGRPPRNVIDQ